MLQIQGNNGYRSEDWMWIKGYHHSAFDQAWAGSPAGHGRLCPASRSRHLMDTSSCQFKSWSCSQWCLLVFSSFYREIQLICVRHLLCNWTLGGVTVKFSRILFIYYFFVALSFLSELSLWEKLNVFDTDTQGPYNHHRQWGEKALLRWVPIWLWEVCVACSMRYAF